MKLLSLQLHNFRQFHGTTPKLNLAPSTKSRNVIIIHGSNGSGKTAILNAFTWGLYGAFTKGFQHRDRIVNRRALREAETVDSVNAWIEMEFEHGDYRYTLRRTVRAIRNPETRSWHEDSNNIVDLWSCGRNGKWKQEKYFNETVGCILPKDLHTYFFFDGERIERMVRSTSEEKEALRKATKRLLNIELFYRAIRHLDQARKVLENELKQIGDPELADLISSKQSQEKELDTVANRRGEIQQTLHVLKLRKQEIESRLREQAESRQLQRKRDRLIDSQQELMEQQRQRHSEMSSLVSKKGHAAFLVDTVSEVQRKIDTMRLRGELPAGVKRQFVDDLLSREKCICDRHLSDNSDAREAVKVWRTRAGLADVEEKILLMGGECSTLENIRTELLQNISVFQEQSVSTRNRLSDIEHDLDKIHKEMKSVPTETIGELEKERQHVDDNISQFNRDFGRLENEGHNLQKEIQKIDQRIHEEELRGKRQKRAQARVAATKRAGSTIETMVERYGEMLRGKLNSRLQSIFRRMTVTPYVPRLSEDWSLELRESVGGPPLPVAASQGENQVLSLAFLASIIEETRSKLPGMSEIMSMKSDVVPIVMDSPFGSLDRNYRAQVAEYLPGVADQLILLLTETQWRGEVEESVNINIARSYVLTYFTSRDDIEAVGIAIDGSYYPLVRNSPNGFEYTEIGEVSNG